MNKCLQLTEEFRNLSENHSNHEDKLQVCINRDMILYICTNFFKGRKFHKSKLFTFSLFFLFSQMLKVVVCKNMCK